MKELTPEEWEIKEGKALAVLSYIGPLCIAPFLFRRENRFAIHHAKQGLVIFALEIATFILSVAPLVGILLKLVGITVFTIFCLWGMFQAFLGFYSELPVISGLARKITF